LESFHVHEIVVVSLAEIINNSIKNNSMKETIFKIGTHLMISGFLTNLGSMIIKIGGQAFPLDRLCINYNLNVQNPAN